MKAALNPASCAQSADSTSSFDLMKAETDRIRALAHGSFTVALASVAMMGEALVIFMQQVAGVGEELRPMQLARENVEQYVQTAGGSSNTGRDHFLANLLALAAHGERHLFGGFPVQALSTLAGEAAGIGQFLAWVMQSMPLLQSVDELMQAGRACMAAAGDGDGDGDGDDEDATWAMNATEAGEAGLVPAKELVDRLALASVGRASEHFAAVISKLRHDFTSKKHVRGVYDQLLPAASVVVEDVVVEGFCDRCGTVLGGAFMTHLGKNADVCLRCYCTEVETVVSSTHPNHPLRLGRRSFNGRRRKQAYEESSRRRKQA
jgi:hypothetical protein